MVQLVIQFLASGCTSQLKLLVANWFKATISVIFRLHREKHEAITFSTRNRGEHRHKARVTYRTLPISPQVNNVFCSPEWCRYRLLYKNILRFRGCPKLPKIKFGGWPNREVWLFCRPCPPPIPVGAPAAPATMTHVHTCTLNQYR